LSPYLSERGTWKVRLGSVVADLELVKVPVECEDGKERFVLWGVCLDVRQLLRFVLSWDPELTPQQVAASWDEAAEDEARGLVGAGEEVDLNDAHLDALWDAEKDSRAAAR